MGLAIVNVEIFLLIVKKRDLSGFFSPREIRRDRVYNPFRNNP